MLFRKLLMLNLSRYCLIITTQTSIFIIHLLVVFRHFVSDGVLIGLEVDIVLRATEISFLRLEVTLIIIVLFVVCGQFHLF